MINGTEKLRQRKVAEQARRMANAISSARSGGLSLMDIKRARPRRRPRYDYAVHVPPELRAQCAYL